ncbi:MAG: hypothetical protein KDC84_12215 [Crocinitomicaceae bacterium]|nr:hypothetical protein [Crocinitomicaceae bacterium]
MVFIWLSVVLLGFTFQDESCKYDSILDLKENEGIKYKQVTKLSYYSQISRFAIRRDYHEIDLIFSSIFDVQNKKFESFKDRDPLQKYFSKTDYILRIQFTTPLKKLDEGEYEIGKSGEDSLGCVVRLYHVDKVKQGMKLISRKFSVSQGYLKIEKISASTFCGEMKLDIPEFYNLFSQFSLPVTTRDN